MKPRSSRRRNRTAASITIAAILALTGCAGPQITSPVGEWVAADDDHGTLSIRSDGTFTMTDASFNPLRRADPSETSDADNNFNATGTWLIVPGDPNVKLNFKEASEGEWDVEPGGFDVPFRSGTIRFHDPDDVLDIEFRFVDETPE